METYEKIRLLRELNQWSQEEMAEKLHMSTGGYAKIERGESSLSLKRLEQIAQIFNLNILELIHSGQQGFIVQINDGDNNSDISFYASSEEIGEVERLKSIIQHKDELLHLKEELLQQEKQKNQLLQEMISLMKAKK